MILALKFFYTSNYSLMKPTWRRSDSLVTETVMFL